MTSNKLIIGLFGLLLLSSIINAYTVIGTDAWCGMSGTPNQRCADCTIALNDTTLTTVYLNASINGVPGDCINISINSSGKTFDGNGYYITGTGIPSDGIVTGPSPSQPPQNLTIINMNISNFGSRIIAIDKVNATNITIRDSVIYDSNIGISLQTSSGNYVQNVTSYNCTVGFYVIQAEDNDLVGCTAYDSAAWGFLIWQANYTEIDDSLADNCGVGFSIVTSSHHTNLTNVTVRNSGAQGIQIDSSHNNTVSYSHVYNNDFHGIDIGNFAHENVINTTNVSYNGNVNPGYGIYIHDTSFFNNITSTNVSSSGVDGICIYQSCDFNIIYWTRSFDNNNTGINISQESDYNTIFNSLVYENDGHGIYVFDSIGTNIITASSVAGYPGAVYENNQSGIYLERGDQSAIGGIGRNLTVYSNNMNGVSLIDGSWVNLMGNFVVNNNTQHGISLESNSDSNNFTIGYLYGNGQTPGFYNIYIDSTSNDNLFSNIYMYTNKTGFEHTRHISQQGTASPSNNFTMLSVCYNETIGCAVWDFLDLSDAVLSSANFIADPSFISLDSTVANGGAEFNESANITIASDRCAPLPDVYRQTGFPTSKAEILTGSIYPTTLSCVNNVARFNVSSFSGYTVASLDTCQIISSPGTYNLSGDVTGATIPFGNVWGLSNTCILIESSDVDFTCNGFSVTNNGTANSVGIAVNASGVTPYTNITIRDCPAISLYREGVYTQNGYYNRIQNSTAYNNTEAGFMLINAIGNNITDNTAYSTGASGTSGFFLGGNGINLLLNNTAYSTETAFDFYLCAINNITDNWAYNNSIAFRLNTSSNNNDLWYNRADNNDYGFQLLLVDGNNLISNTVGNNAIVAIDLQAADNSNITDNNLSGGAYGIAMGGTPINNDFYDNVVYDTSYGLYMRLNSNNNNFINNELYDNARGVDMQDGDGNNFTDNIIHGNTQYGLYIVSSDNNDFFDNEVYNHSGYGDYGFYLNTCTANTFVHNDVYFNHFGFYLDTVDNNNFTDNDAHDNIVATNGFTGTAFYFTNSQSNIIDNNLAYRNGNGMTFDAPAGLPALFQNNEIYENYIGLNLLNDANGFDFNNTNYSGNDVHDNNWTGLFVEDSHNNIITKSLLLHDNPQFEIYGAGTISNITIEETNTAEEEYVTLANGATVTNLYLMYDYTDVHGRVNFHTVTVTAASGDTPLNNTNFLLEPDFVSLNDTEQADYNVTATVTLNTSACPVRVYREEGFPQSRDEIITNGSVYAATGLSCSYLENTAEFDVASFSGYAVDLAPPPPGGDGGDGDECDDLEIELVEIECPSDTVVLRFVDDIGDPIVGERTRVDGPVLPTQYYDTDSDGEISFTAWADGIYRIRVTTASDYCEDEYVLTYTLCPEEGCYDDEDCYDYEYCDLTTSTPGVCRDVECECGDVYDHRCHEYECCADEDCDEGERCVDHECVEEECEDDSGCAGDESCSDGACIPVEGDCGYAENHTWYNYECCGDDDCPFGFVCQEFNCVLYRIITNETGFVGDDHLAYVLPQGQYTVGIIDPLGKEHIVETDEVGNVWFLLEAEGEYSIYLAKDVGAAANVTVDALTRRIIPEEKPVTILDQLLNLCWVLIILALLVIGYILYRRREEEQKKKKK